MSVTDQEAVEGLARLEAPFPPDELHAVVEGDWGFVDVARKDARGEWAESVSGLYRRRQGRWALLEWGDPSQWDHYKRDMNPRESSAFDGWHSGHF